MEQKKGTPLSEDVIERIAAEEMVRLEIREGLHNRKKAEDPKSKAMKFLNSGFGLFLLSTIFVSGAGILFNYWAGKTKENQEKQQVEKRLLAEFEFRLSELDGRMADLKATNSGLDRQSYTIYIYRAAMGAPEFQPALPEFKSEHWAGIIIQLDDLGISTNGDAAIAATRDLAGSNYDGQDDQGHKYFTYEYLEQREKVLRAYRDDARKIIVQ